MPKPIEPREGDRILAMRGSREHRFVATVIEKVRDEGWNVWPDADRGASGCFLGEGAPTEIESRPLMCGDVLVGPTGGFFRVHDLRKSEVVLLRCDGGGLPLHWMKPETRPYNSLHGFHHIVGLLVYPERWTREEMIRSYATVEDVVRMHPALKSLNVRGTLVTEGDLWIDVTRQDGASFIGLKSWAEVADFLNAKNTHAPHEPSPQELRERHDFGPSVIGQAYKGMIAKEVATRLLGRKGGKRAEVLRAAYEAALRGQRVRVIGPEGQVDIVPTGSGISPGSQVMHVESEPKELSATALKVYDEVNERRFLTIGVDLAAPEGDRTGFVIYDNRLGDAQRIGAGLAYAGLLATKVEEIARSFWDADEDIQAHVAGVADHELGEEESDWERLEATYERAWEIDALGLRTWWTEKTHEVLRRVSRTPYSPLTPLLTAYLQRRKP